MTTYTHFNKNPEKINAAFADCIQKSRNTASLGKIGDPGCFSSSDEWHACDNFALYFCAQEANKQTSNCACINAKSIGGAPLCNFNPCISGGGYIPSLQYTMVKNKLCPPTINCSQVLELGGESNVASNLTQGLNCGGVESNMSFNPYIFIVVIILIISVMMLLLGSNYHKDNSNHQNSVDDQTNY